MMQENNTEKLLVIHRYRETKPIYVKNIATSIVLTAILLLLCIFCIIGGGQSLFHLTADDVTFDSLPKHTDIYIEDMTFYGKYNNITDVPVYDELWNIYLKYDNNNMLFSFKDANGEEVYGLISLGSIKDTDIYDRLYNHFITEKRSTPISVSMFIRIYSYVSEAEAYYQALKPDGNDHIIKYECSNKYASRTQYYGNHLSYILPLLILLFILLYFTVCALVRNISAHMQIAECIKEEKLVSKSAKTAREIMLRNEKLRDLSKILLPLLWTAYVIGFVCTYNLIKEDSIFMFITAAMPIGIYTFVFFTRMRRLHLSYKKLLATGEEHLADQVFITPLFKCDEFKGFYFSDDCFYIHSKGIFEKYSNIQKISVDLRFAKPQVSEIDMLILLLNLISAYFGMIIWWYKNKIPHIVLYLDKKTKIPLMVFNRNDLEYTVKTFKFTGEVESTVK